jgi:hypothetical protein
MRVMVLVKASKDTEAGVMPNERRPDRIMRMRPVPGQHCPAVVYEEP